MEIDATQNIASKHGKYDALCTYMLKEIVRYQISGVVCGAYRSEVRRSHRHYQK